MRCHFCCWGSLVAAMLQKASNLVATSRAVFCGCEYKSALLAISLSALKCTASIIKRIAIKITMTILFGGTGCLRHTGTPLHLTSYVASTMSAKSASATCCYLKVCTRTRMPSRSGLSAGRVWLLKRDGGVMKEIREYNLVGFDFVLKWSLREHEKRMSCTIFETS